MSTKLQITLIIVSILTSIVIIRNIYRSKMETKYAVIWILWSLSLIIMSVFPWILDRISVLLGIATPTNALFAINLFLMYIIIFYLFKKISRHREEIKTLNYEVALLKKKLRDQDERDGNK